MFANNQSWMAYYVRCFIVERLQVPMQIHTNMSLRSFNTFGVEVTAARYVGIDTEAEIDDA
ncbi:MAG: hypothetical protein CR984_01870, partial [Proteobacteria bacterium]